MTIPTWLCRWAYLPILMIHFGSCSLFVYLAVNHMILSHDNFPIGYIVVIELLSVLTFWPFESLHRCAQSPLLLKFALLIYFKYLPRQFISILESIRWKESHCVSHVIDYNVMCLIWHGTILYSVLLMWRICTMTSDWSRNLFLNESFRILLVFGWKKKIICHKKYVYSMSISQGLLTNCLCHRSHSAFKRFTDISIMAFKRVWQNDCCAAFGSQTST